MSDIKSKSVLGKGLSALIPRVAEQGNTVSVEKSGNEDSIITIEVSKISPNPYQPRLDFNVQALEELKRSIAEKGIIQPIAVRKLVSGLYELISGERRVRAAQELGLKKIPAHILNITSAEEMLELGLIENLQREDLNAIEIAISYQRLISECQLTQEDVAQKIGKDRSTITNFLRLLKLPEKVQQSVRTNKISMGHARSLLSLNNEKLQLRFHDKIVNEGMSVRQIEYAVKNLHNPEPKKKNNSSKSTARGDVAFQSIETKLKQTLGTKVSIRKNSSGGGEIVVEYYTADDLERLIELLGG